MNERARACAMMAPELYDVAPPHRSGASLRQLEWSRDGADWPLHGTSRFVSTAHVDWHVQVCGHGPVALLLHGTGASTHSWRGLAPLLAAHFTLVMPDLPGHAFSRMADQRRLSLAGMSADVSALLGTLALTPVLVIGHSAGAALALAMSSRGFIAPQTVISVNGALLAFDGLPGRCFAPLARTLARGSLMPRWFARRAARAGVVEGLLDSTGSILGDDGIAYYRRLASNPAHVAAALGMMANWDLAQLAPALPRCRHRVELLVADGDRMIPPEQAYRVARLLPRARVSRMSGLGHLAHEEAPAVVAAQCLRAAREAGVLEQGA